MRHRVSGRKLGRTASHRKATLAALCTALIQHKRIQTTVAKAKETQRVVEPIINRAKKAYQKESAGESKDVHARRIISRTVHDRAVLKELFEEVAPKVAERNGGFTRVVKLGQRLGDGAQVAVLELVDFNEAVTKKAKAKKKKAEKTVAPQETKEETAAPAAEQVKEPDEEKVEEKELKSEAAKPRKKTASKKQTKKGQAPKGKASAEEKKKTSGEEEKKE